MGVRILRLQTYVPVVGDLRGVRMKPDHAAELRKQGYIIKVSHRRVFAEAPEEMGTRFDGKRAGYAPTGSNFLLPAVGK